MYVGLVGILGRSCNSSGRVKRAGLKFCTVQSRYSNHVVFAVASSSPNCPVQVQLQAERFFGRPKLALDAVGADSAARLADALEQVRGRAMSGLMLLLPTVVGWELNKCQIMPPLEARLL